MGVGQPPVNGIRNITAKGIELLQKHYDVHA